MSESSPVASSVTCDATAVRYGRFDTHLLMISLYVRLD